MRNALRTLKKHILTGTSHMIPFIVAGGILYSVSLMLNPAGTTAPTELHFHAQQVMQNKRR